MACVFAILTATGCPNRPISAPTPTCETEIVYENVEADDKDVDLLFVIDNSDSMEEEQKLLANNFPRFIERLRIADLGSDGSGKPCSAADTSGCKIPNVRIGVTTSDLGVGNYTNIPTCQIIGGDAGRLINKPGPSKQASGCVGPTDKWLLYNGNKSPAEVNVSKGSPDPIARLKESFSCVAEVGIGGCGVEQHLQSARRALDPALNVNPGFLRPDALLAIVIIGDEDDCSLQKPELFDPNLAKAGINGELGPLSDYRCIEFGLQCEGTPPQQARQLGVRKNCEPAFEWLYSVTSYIDFFKGLKTNPDRVLVAGIIGPKDSLQNAPYKDNTTDNRTDLVKVVPNSTTAQSPPTLENGCVGSSAFSVPGVRLQKFMDGFGSDNAQFTNICEADYGPAMEKLADRIKVRLKNCLSYPIYTTAGELTCIPGAPAITPGATCNANNLPTSDCVLTQKSGGNEIVVPKCSDALFTNANATNCGSECPCWRIVRDDTCLTKGTPLRYEILRQGQAPVGSEARLSCNSAPYKWGDDKLSDLQCQ